MDSDTLCSVMVTSLGEVLKGAMPSRLVWLTGSSEDTSSLFVSVGRESWVSFALSSSSSDEEYEWLPLPFRSLVSSGIDGVRLCRLIGVVAARVSNGSIKSSI